VCGLGGFKDVVRHGETGYLVDTVLTKHGVRVDWATAAHQVVRVVQEPDLRARMGARAAAWARQRFTIAAVAPHLGAVVSGERSAPDRAEPTVDGGLV
jgi:glycosyltransferase involved in cell wall biosynthesis